MQLLALSARMIVATRALEAHLGVAMTTTLRNRYLESVVQCTARVQAQRASSSGKLFFFKVCVSFSHVLLSVLARDQRNMSKKHDHEVEA